MDKQTEVIKELKKISGDYETDEDDFYKDTLGVIEQLQAELAEQKEENEKLRKVFADYPDMMERLTKHSKEQTKEVERLKESLIEIGDYAYEGHRDSRVDEHSCLYKVSNMASKALGNPEKGGG